MKTKDKMGGGIGAGFFNKNRTHTKKYSQNKCIEKVLNVYL